MNALHELPFRLRDVLLSFALLVLFAPLLAIVAVAIRLESPGPIVFRQVRVGRYGRPFRIHKFRSMRASAPGLAISTSNDARITRVGRIIRTTKIDELPQIFDVLRGTMSFVGPRPEVPRYVEEWPRELRPVILSVRPGITDPATVILRNEAEFLAGHDDPERVYIEHLLPRKAEEYADYVSKRTFIGDIRIVAATVRAIVRPAAVGDF